MLLPNIFHYHMFTIRVQTPRLFMSRAVGLIDQFSYNNCLLDRPILKFYSNSFSFSFFSVSRFHI